MSVERVSRVNLESRLNLTLAAALALGLFLAAGCRQEPGTLTSGQLARNVESQPGGAVLNNSVLGQTADMRRDALYKMSSWKEPQPNLVELIGLTLQGDADATVRAQAARTLGAWARPVSVKDLSQALATDGNKFVRCDSAEALGRIPDDKAIEHLAGALQFDPDEDVRIRCARALRYQKSPATAGQLLPGLTDRSLAVRSATEESLNYLTGRDLGQEPAAWQKFLAESPQPLADYGRMPKKTPPKVDKIDPNAGGKAKAKEIFGDLFPLERKPGPFD